MDDILIVPGQVLLQSGIRPREGAVKGSDGKWADADLEVVVQVCVPMVESGPAVLDKDGRSKAIGIPVGLVSRSLSEMQAEAAKAFGPTLVLT